MGVNSKKCGLSSYRYVSFSCPAILIMLQPDVGSMLVFAVLLVVLYRQGLSGWIFILGFCSYFPLCHSAIYEAVFLGDFI